MVFRFVYHSTTQQVVHVAPVVVAMLVGIWLSGRYQDVGIDVCMAGLGWMVISNFIVNLLIEDHGLKTSVFDFSKNLHPTGAETVVRNIILMFSVLGGAGAGMVVANRFPIPPAHIWGVLLLGFLALLVVGGSILLGLTFMTIVLSGFRFRPVRG